MAAARERKGKRPTADDPRARPDRGELPPRRGERPDDRVEGDSDLHDDGRTEGDVERGG